MSIPFLNKDGLTYFWNKIKNLVEGAFRNNDRTVEYVVGTQIAATNAFTGVTEDNALYDGKCINYKLPYAGTSSAATLNLTLADGTLTGAKPVYVSNTTRLTNHKTAGQIIMMTYNATLDCWQCDDYWMNSNNYDRRLHNNNIRAASAITAKKIIVGDKNGYKNLAAGVTFDISYAILWASAAIAVGTPKATAYECYPSVSLQDTVSGWTGTQWSMVYLVGTLSGTTFTVDSSVLTTIVPTTADGKVYIPIGILYSTYQLFFAPTKDMYAFKAGAFRPLFETPNVSVSINDPGTEVWIEVPMEHLIVGSVTPTDTNALWMEVITE